MFKVTDYAALNLHISTRDSKNYTNIIGMPTDYWPGDNMNMYTCASTFALILQYVKIHVNFKVI